jgi:uncharacterized OB-fold protein
MKKNKRVPIKEGIMTFPLHDEKHVRLAGAQCRDCREVFFGTRPFCENCSGSHMESITFSQRGFLWSYTVIQQPPPPGYKVPGPFKPFGLGLVELPEGIRILAPIEGPTDQLRIGMELESEIYPLYINKEGQEVMAFKFRPV